MILKYCDKMYFLGILLSALALLCVHTIVWTSDRNSLLVALLGLRKPHDKFSDAVWRTISRFQSNHLSVPTSATKPWMQTGFVKYSMTMLIQFHAADIEEEVVIINVTRASTFLKSSHRTCGWQHNQSMDWKRTCRFRMVTAIYLLNDLSVLLRWN